ncbi:hypothetical protein J6590_074649 [Homalodisca vitripennis]|nr:hypothetical protein J6590_074649 [Homalodisca vitripennis]
MAAIQDFQTAIIQNAYPIRTSQAHTEDCRTKVNCRYRYYYLHYQLGSDVVSVQLYSHKGGVKDMYNSTVWAPCQSGHASDIESVKVASSESPDTGGDTTQSGSLDNLGSVAGYGWGYNSVWAPCQSGLVSDIESVKVASSESPDTGGDTTQSGPLVNLGSSLHQSRRIRVGIQLSLGPLTIWARRFIRVAGYGWGYNSVWAPCQSGLSRRIRVGIVWTPCQSGLVSNIESVKVASSESPDTGWDTTQSGHLVNLGSVAGYGLGYNSVWVPCQSGLVSDIESVKARFIRVAGYGLGYNSVWASCQSGLVSDIESVKVRFIRVAGYGLGYNYLHVTVSLIKMHFSLFDLDGRRRIQNLVLLMRLVRGVVFCSELLLELLFHLPGRTRPQNMYFTMYHSVVNFPALYHSPTV